MNICTGSEAIIKEIISFNITDSNIIYFNIINSNITDSDNIALNITDSDQTLKGRIWWNSQKYSIFSVCHLYYS